MNRLVLYVLVSVIFASFSAKGLVGQAPGQVKKPPSQKSHAELKLQSALASPKGVELVVSVKQAGSLYCTIWSVTELIAGGDENFTSVVDSISAPLPEGLKGSSALASGKVNVPAAVQPDATVKYAIGCTGTGISPEVGESESSNLRFSGYTLTAADLHGYSPKISDSIKVTIGAQNLQVSAKTKDIVELYARWASKASEETSEVNWSAAVKHQDPALTLPYPNIEATPGKQSEIVPLVLALRSNDGSVQEARITLAIEASQSITQKAQTVKNPNTTDARRDRVSFSWRELAATGLGSIVKYFLM